MFNKARLALFVAILSAAAGAIVFRTPSVLFLLATLLAAPLLASAMGKWMSRGLRVSRQMALVGTVGDELRALVTVRNRGMMPALLVHAHGRGPTEKPRSAQPRSARGHRATSAPMAAFPTDDGAEFFEVVGEDELSVPILMPGASFSGEVVWKLRRRGLVPWPGARAGTVDPIALSDGLMARDAPAELLILPRPLKLRRLSLGGGAAAQPLQRMATAADAAEIHGVRPHQPGESGRRIHWRATARTGELHVIEWETENAADVTILLDVQASCIAGIAGDDTLEQGIIAAASVAAYLLERGQRARIFWWADVPTAPDATGLAANVAGVVGNVISLAANVAGVAEGVAIAPDVAGVASGPRLMRVEARHQTGLTQITMALAKVVPCHSGGATLAALSRRVAPEVGEESALLIGSDAAAWEAALAPWKRGQHRAGAYGLASKSASFEGAEVLGAEVLGAEVLASATAAATPPRAATSKTRRGPTLPAGVRRVARGDSLVEALEKEF